MCRRLPKKQREMLELTLPAVADNHRAVRALVSLVAALALGWSSVVDNAAVCPDEGPASSSRPCNDDGVPAAPCFACPCHLPSLRAPAFEDLRPQLVSESLRTFWPEQQLQVAEPVPPPTPPPLA